MRSGSQTGTSYLPDYLPLLNMLSATHEYFRHVKVLCGIRSVVFYFYEISVTAGIACLFDGSGCCSHNRSSGGRCLIRSIMRFPTQLNRMKTTSCKTGCNVYEFKWRFQKHVFQHFSVLIEIIDFFGIFILFERKGVAFFSFLFKIRRFNTFQTKILTTF